VIFVATKKGRATNFFLPSLLLLVLDPRSGIGDKHRGSSTLQSARVSCRSSDLAPPSPLPLVCVPPQDPKGGGGTHSLLGKGVVGANSDEGTDTMVLCILIPSLWAGGTVGCKFGPRKNRISNSSNEIGIHFLGI
jgi:hypothetical protein